MISSIKWWVREYPKISITVGIVVAVLMFFIVGLSARAYSRNLMNQRIGEVLSSEQISKIQKNSKIQVLDPDGEYRTQSIVDSPNHYYKVMNNILFERDLESKFILADKEYIDTIYVSSDKKYLPIYNTVDGYYSYVDADMKKYLKTALKDCVFSVEFKEEKHVRGQEWERQGIQDNFIKNNK